MKLQLVLDTFGPEGSKRYLSGLYVGVLVSYF